MLKSLTIKSPKIAFPGNCPIHFKNVSRRHYEPAAIEGCFLNESGRWEYDHTNDLEELESRRLKAEAAAAARAHKDAAPKKIEHRITLANATAEQVRNALHKALCK